MVQIVLLGGGPKSVALVSKLACFHSFLKNNPFSDFNVTIIEPHEIGANWGGGYGFSDGEMRLCTDPLRDLGFPYHIDIERSLFGNEFGHCFMGMFSWQSFLNEERALGDWIAKKKPQPSHMVFRDYLQWAFGKAQTHLGSRLKWIKAKATEIDIEKNGKHFIVSTGNESTKIECDRIVVTGSHDKRSRFQEDKPYSKSWFFSGANFWLPKNLNKFERLQNDTTLDRVKIAIVGGGGTASAIANKLCNYDKFDITIIGRRAFLGSRNKNYFFDRIYHDIEHWDRISEKNKNLMLTTVDKGQSWDCVVNELENHDNLYYQPGSVEEITFNRRPRYRGMKFYGFYAVRCDDGYEDDYKIVIDATTFDSCWFNDILSKNTVGILCKGCTDEQIKDKCKYFRSSIQSDLSLPIDELDNLKLQVPNLGGMISPNSTNLMGLGLLSANLLMEDYRGLIKIRT